MSSECSIIISSKWKANSPNIVFNNDATFPHQFELIISYILNVCYSNLLWGVSFFFTGLTYLFLCQNYQLLKVGTSPDCDKGKFYKEMDISVIQTVLEHI